MSGNPDDILRLPLKHFRAKVASGSSSVERDGGNYGYGVVRGVSVITRGEALGHDLWIDADFLSDTTAAINAKSVGLKARFTHPGLSSDGLGKYLGKLHDAKTVGDRVVADLHFKESATKTPDGDLAGYVMTLAEDAPEDFGVSIVFDEDMQATEIHRLENIQGGRFVSPDEDNKQNYSHARLDVLRAADVVDSPAANPDGLFHRDQDIAHDAENLFSYALGITDERPLMACLDVDADRISAAVQRFLSRHGLSISMKDDVMSKESAQETVADPGQIPQPTRETFATELKRFSAEFGPKGAEWYADGKSWAECQALTIEEQRRQLAARDATIEDLKNRLNSVDLGEKKPAGFGDGTQQEERPKTFANRIRINGSVGNHN